MSKRIICLLVATFMVISFAGCRKTPADSGSSVDIEYEYINEPEGGTNANSNNETNANSNSNNNVNSNNNSNTSSVKLEGNTYTSGFPIVKNKEKLKIMSLTRTDVGDTSKSQFNEVYSKMTNIDVEWDLVQENNASQRKTIALQTGSLPDIFAFGKPYMTDADILQYSNEGAFVEITKDMLKKWAPNIYASYDKYKSWNDVKDSTGKMHTIAGYTKDFPYGQHFVWVRKSWLNKLGINTPKTMDDFYKMLVAFKNNDPNGNGQKDEVPYAMITQGGFFTHAWGFSGTFNVSKNGKVTCMFTTQNMKNALTYWNKVYKEGLVDTKTINSYSGNYAAFKTLLSSGKVGAFWYGWPSEAMDDKLLSEYEPLVWPTAGNNGDFPSSYVEAQSIVYPIGFVITKACKNVPAALRWLDYLYTNDGYMLKTYGKEGDRWQKVDNNTYKIISSAKDGVIYGPRWTIKGRSFLDDAELIEDTNLQAKLRNACEQKLETLYKSNGQKMMPSAFMNKNEIQQTKLYSTYFDTLSGKQYDFIKGTLNLNSDFTALQNEISAKGLDKYLEVLQSYYDRCN